MQHDDVVDRRPDERATPEAPDALGEDAAVVAAVRSGDELAFARLVRPHERALLAHCTRLLRGRPEAEDALQEALLRAWRHRARFEGRSSFRGWLFRIATNACTDVLRKPATRHSVAVASVEDVAGEGAPGPGAAGRTAAGRAAAPDDALVARESVELALLAALDQLPTRQQAVLCVRDMLGWPAEEAAELLDMTVPAVNSALQRARATLRSRRPADRQDWSAGSPSRHRRQLVRRLMDAGDRHDGPGVASLLRLAS